MIPALILWLVKKHWLQSKKDVRPVNKTRAAWKKATGLLLLFMLSALFLKAQQQVHQYRILYKGNDIGNMYLTQLQNGDALSIKLISNIQMNMLMRINVRVAEETSYKEDKLMYSAVYRKVNGKEKANRQTRYCNGCYEIITEGKKGMLNKTAITYNLARLYCKEPVNISEVYSDAFQQFLPIEVMGNHQYKLTLPDGNYNMYYFQNGMCTKVEVHNTLYTVQMLLVQNSIF